MIAEHSKAPFQKTGYNGVQRRNEKLLNGSVHHWRKGLRSYLELLRLTRQARRSPRPSAAIGPRCPDGIA